MPGEAQRKLGLPASTFNYYVKQGRITAHTRPLGKERIYKREEIDRLAEEGITPSRPARKICHVCQQPIEGEGIIEHMSGGDIILHARCYAEQHGETLEEFIEKQERWASQAIWLKEEGPRDTPSQTGRAEEGGRE